MISETGEYHQPDTEMAPSAGISVSRVPWIFMMEIVCVSEGPFSGAKLKPMCGAASIGTIAASRCASFCPTSNVIRPPLLSPVANSIYVFTQKFASISSRIASANAAESSHAHHTQGTRMSIASSHSPGATQSS